MTGSRRQTQDEPTRPISVAELLAKNGTIGAPPVTGRRRRRPGHGDAVTVAEHTGEIPVIRDDVLPDAQPAEPQRVEPVVETGDVDPPAVAAPRVEHVDHHLGSLGWVEAQSRWPKSPRQSPRDPGSGMGPQRTPDPRPARRTGVNGAEVRATPVSRPTRKPDAEQVVPEAADNHIEVPAGAMDHVAADDNSSGVFPERHTRWPGLVDGAAIVGESILAVALGAGLFVGFDQLWRWNNIVALVLTVLVTLGLVAAVQAVRKTVDIASTLIAVAVGLLITLGPLALNAN